MTVSIKNIYPASNSEWDHIWEQCDYATFYHSRLWPQVWDRYLKGKIYQDALIIEFSDHKKALLPLSCHKVAGGMLKRYLSSPARTYGGPISLDQLETAHIRLVSQHLLNNCSNLILRINPFDSPLYAEELQPKISDETHVLDLRKDFDDIFSSWTKGHRSAVSKARKIGVTIRVGELENDWKQYYEIYLSSFQRWGDQATSKYGWEFFKAFSELETPHVKLWLAEYQNNPIAGAVILYAKKHAIYGYSATLEKYFEMRPMNLLIYEIIKNVSKENYTWFDFNASGGHQGVINFKKSFGSQKLPCSIVDHQSHLLKFLEKIYKKWLIKTSRFKSQK